jgi:hypothetical protein
MALRTPPSWLQNGSHPAENDRLTTQALYSSTGTIGASSLAITAQASPDMTVNAATGWCSVLSSTANGGVYVAYNDAVTVLTVTAADPSLPRIDRIVVTVSDAYYSGATNTVAFQVLAGTPNASPTAPATPSDSISLATIAVAASATTVAAANITDTRTSATSSSFLPLTGGTVTGSMTFSGATTVSGAFAISGATTLTNTVSSTSTITASSLIASAGTASVAPLKLTSGTNLTTPQAGAFEYDGSLAYFTPEATSAKRGLLGADYWYSNSGVVSLGTGATPQSMFGVGITLPVGRYEMRLVAVVTASVATAHNHSFGFSGTAATSNITTRLVSVSSQGQSVAPEQTSFSSTVGTYTTLFSANSTATTTNIVVSGVVAVSTAGTLIPTIQFSTAVAGSNTVATGSSVIFRRIGASATGNVSIGAWA